LNLFNSLAACHLKTKGNAVSGMAGQIPNACLAQRHRLQWSWCTRILPSRKKIERLPVEVGVMLIAAGATTGMLPPPPRPFDLSIIVSGGLVLWPQAFRAIDGWTHRRFPAAHRTAMGFLGRYLDDLERRYPGPG
jgi:hypothetical protein